MVWTRQRCQVAFISLARAPRPSWASETTSLTPRRPCLRLRKNSVQKVSLGHPPRLEKARNVGLVGCLLWADLCRPRAVLEVRYSAQSCLRCRHNETAGSRGFVCGGSPDSAFVVIYTSSPARAERCMGRSSLDRSATLIIVTLARSLFLRDGTASRGECVFFQFSAYATPVYPASDSPPETGQRIRRIERWIRQANDERHFSPRVSPLPSCTGHSRKPLAKLSCMHDVRSFYRRRASSSRHGHAPRTLNPGCARRFCHTVSPSRCRTPCKQIDGS